MEERLPTIRTDIDQSVNRSSNASSSLDGKNSIFRTVMFTSCALLVSVVVTAAFARMGAERFPGILMADASHVLSPSDGVIEWVDATPGEIVHPGTSLFVIRDTQLDLRIQDAQYKLDAVKVNLAAAIAQSELELQQRTTKLETSAFETELTLTGLLQQQFQNKFESTALGDYLDLFDVLASTEIPAINLKMLAMPRQSDEYRRLQVMIDRAEAENGREALQTRVELCETRLKDLRGAISRLPDQIEIAHRIPDIQASVETISSELDGLMETDAERSVNSPIYGMAGVLRIQVQDSVDQGDLLLEVFDREREFVTVVLPARLVAELENDQLVTIHFPSGEDRLGKIDSIPPQLTLNKNRSGGESTVSLKVRSTGKPWPTLPIGSSIDVSID